VGTGCERGGTFIARHAKSSELIDWTTWLPYFALWKLYELALGRRPWS
jgi:hypothetical protein